MSNARLKNLITLNTKCTIAEPRPYVALEHIASGTGALEERVELPIEMPKPNGMVSVEPGDVLFGKLRPYLAKSWLVDRQAHASTELLCLRPSEYVDSRWLGYLVRSIPFVTWAVASSEGTKMPRTSWEKLGQFRLNPPTLSSQQNMANYLDIETTCIEALISKKRRFMELMDDRKKILGEEALSMFRRQEQLVPLKYLVRESDTRLGLRAQPTLLSVSIHDGVTALGSGSSFESRADNFSNYKICQSGDIVINRMRAFQGALGLANQGGIVSPDYTVLQVGSGVSANYLHFVMRSSWFIAEMTRRLRGIGSTDQGQVRTPRINFADLGLIRIPVPPRERQNEFALNLTHQEERLTHVVDLLTQQLDALGERRQALITAVVTGEMSVPEVQA